MFKQKVLVHVYLISAICLITNLANGALITMDIDASSSISDFDLSHMGDELKIDYLIENTTQTSNLDDALYRVIIPAGTNQSIYAEGTLTLNLGLTIRRYSNSDDFVPLRLIISLYFAMVLYLDEFWGHTTYILY